MDNEDTSTNYLIEVGKKKIKALRSCKIFDAV